MWHRNRNVKSEFESDIEAIIVVSTWNGLKNSKFGYWFPSKANMTDGNLESSSVASNMKFFNNCEILTSWSKTS